MAKTSIIIPSCNESLLQQTVEDIFAKAMGEIEVIVVLDGEHGFILPDERPNLTFIRKTKPEGARIAINQAAALATGEYLLKTDAHSVFAEGFDEILKAECEPDWVVIPRVYALNYDTWQPQGDTGVDYYYLSCPWTHRRFFQMQSCFWYDRTNRRRDILLDEIMTFQGSCWFMPSAYWREHLGGISETDFGLYAEHQEIGLKTWLGGGRVMVNKKTWYAHDHRDNLRRGYIRRIGDFHNSHIMVARVFARDQWVDRRHDFAWLIERFWPLPTELLSTGEIFYWPENWQDYTEGKLKGLVD